MSSKQYLNGNNKRANERSSFCPPPSSSFPQSSALEDRSSKLSRTITIPSSVLKTDGPTYVTPRPSSSSSSSATIAKTTLSLSSPKTTVNGSNKCNCACVIDNVARMVEMLCLHERFSLDYLDVKVITDHLFGMAFTDFTCSNCSSVNHFIPTKIIGTNNQVNFSLQFLPIEHCEQILSGVKMPKSYDYKFDTIIESNQYRTFPANHYIRRAIKKVKLEDGPGYVYMMKQDPVSGKLMYYSSGISNDSSNGGNIRGVILEAA